MHNAKAATSEEIEQQTVEVSVGSSRNAFHRVRFEGRELGRHAGKPTPSVQYEPPPKSLHCKPEPHIPYSWGLWLLTNGEFALHLAHPSEPGGQLVIDPSWGYLKRQFGIPAELAAAVSDELLHDRVVTRT